VYRNGRTATRKQLFYNIIFAESQDAMTFESQQKFVRKSDELFKRYTKPDNEVTNMKARYICT